MGYSSFRYFNYYFTLPFVKELIFIFLSFRSPRSSFLSGSSSPRRGLLFRSISSQSCSISSSILCQKFTKSLEKCRKKGYNLPTLSDNWLYLQPQLYFVGFTFGYSYPLSSLHSLCVCDTLR